MTSIPNDEESIVAVATDVLTRSMGGSVRLGAPTQVGGDRERSTVMRCTVDDAPDGAPASVIIKMARVEDGASGEQDRTREDFQRHRFLSEVAAIRFLGSVPMNPPAGPSFYGSHQQTGVIVLEDLGEVTSLADLLTGRDPDIAAHGLEAYARTMGRLHATTIGQEGVYAAMQGDETGGSTQAWLGIGEWTPRDLPEFTEICTSLGVPTEGEFKRDVGTVGEALAHPGPFLAFNVSDACPDNNLIAGNAVRFFDFEFSGFGHALLEGAYLRLPFPTCWCMGHLPAEVQARAEEIYRTELIHGCPSAADDRVFAEAMLSACAYWTVRSVSWTLRKALERDDEWGIASHRQRHIYRLEALARQTEEDSHLLGIGSSAGKLANALRARWPPDEIELPLYPAFSWSDNGGAHLPHP